MGIGNVRIQGDDGYTGLFACVYFTAESRIVAADKDDRVYFIFTEMIHKRDCFICI